MEICGRAPDAEVNYKESAVFGQIKTQKFKSPRVEMHL